VTDTNNYTKFENGNLKAAETHPALSFDLRVSNGTQQASKGADANPTIAAAPGALRESNFAPEASKGSAGRLISNSGFRIPDPQHKVQDSQLKIQDSRIPAADSAFKIHNSSTEAQLPRLSAQQLQFLLRIAPAALESERVYQIPAAVTLAQAIIESATSAGWGSSSLFRLANNPFGIKYEHYGAAESHSEGQGASNRATPAARTLGTPTGNEVPAGGDSGSQLRDSKATPPGDPYGAFDAQTWEIVNGQKKIMIAQFQRFPNLTEAFVAHAQLLCSPHYRPAFDVRHDWKQFAERLGPKSSPLDTEHCGYSTNPGYSASLIKLVELYRLNDPRAVQWFATGEDPGPGATSTTEGPWAGRAIAQSNHQASESPQAASDQFKRLAVSSS
jgi:flagellum-specific peptidoglycan hydrolase FlgJ